ncbi:MAG: iron-sulfur cluster assembly scaffold protein [Chloroflexi bacterium]|nr:iron-sulfur cluster assembly scaffold protein [Chloroflexota bacterium]
MDRTEVLELILDHYENPRNYGEIEDASISRQGGNPGCGDIITVYLKFNGERLEQMTYTGEGCTISQAAASMLTEILPGYTFEQIENMDYHIIEEMLGEELVKMRPKCSTLGLDTLKSATGQYHQQQMR